MKHVVFVALALMLATSGYSQTPTKKEQIKTLLNLTGSGKIGEQMAQNLIATFKKNGAEATDEFWDGFAKKMNANEIIEKMIPIYDSCFTQQDIEGLIAFYKSTVGKKLVDKLPYITQKSFEVGQAWGQKIAAELVEELKQKGYIKE
jgi:hypothetical protein